MHESIWAERALSLFTRPDRAAAITGDLLEESRRRRSFWFNVQVVRTMLSLMAEAIVASPFRTIATLLLGLLLFIVGGVLSATALRSIVVSRVIIEEIGWNPVFSYWWKSLFVWLFWRQVLYPFLFGLVFARLSRGKEVTMCLGLASLLTAFRIWAIVTGHLQLRKGSLDFAFLTLWALVGAGVFVRHRVIKTMLIC